MGFVHVGVYETNEPVPVLDDQALVDHGHGVELILYFLGVDVLTVGAQQHVLDPPSDEDVPLLVHRRKVAGVEPTPFIQDSLCGLLVLVISLHHVHPLGDDLTGDRLRVVAVDSHGHVRHCTSTAPCHELMVVGETDERRCFRGAIAHRERELDILRLICRNLSYQEIADELGISKRTVSFHISNMLSKTGHKSIVGLAVEAADKGYASAP